MTSSDDVEAAETRAHVDLDAVTALCDAATPGPWISYDLSDTQFNSTNDRGWWWVWQESKLPYYGGVMEVRDDGPPNGAIGNANITDSEDGEQEQYDAEFIAQARTLLPTMAAELADLRAKVDAVRKLALRDYQRGLSSASEYDVGGNHTAGRILAALGGAGQDNTNEETT